MMKDFSDLEIIPDRLYGGATGSKIAVKYDDRVWMLKLQQNIKCKDLRNVEISYANDVLSEYIGSHVYAIFEVPVHDTLLGTYKGKPCVLCSDDAYPNRMFEFKEFRNSILEEIGDQPSSGMSTYLSDIFTVIEKSDRLPKRDCYKRFWTMFVIDALIGNTDRNNGNWGFVYNNKFELYEVYDCGGCLNNKRSDNQMSRDLCEDRIRNLALNYTFNYRLDNSKRINPFHFIKNNCNPHIEEALGLFTSERLDAILMLVDSCTSGVRNKWIKEVLSIRFNELKSHQSNSNMPPISLEPTNFSKEEYLKGYLDIMPKASIDACKTKEDCDNLLSRLGLSK